MEGYFSLFSKNVGCGENDDERGSRTDINISLSDIS